MRIKFDNRGVPIYVDKELISKQVYLNSHFPEYVLISIQGNKEQILICNVYRSPNLTFDNNKILLNLIRLLANSVKDKLLLLGDFNLGGIDWSTGNTINMYSREFIEVLRDNMLAEYVHTPTKARGEDTPHILNLVISNENFLNGIDHFAPLGKSDHCILNISCIWQNKTKKIRGL